MHQYKAETAKPNPKSIINSYRSFGYNLSTAIADIVDNSISAKADIISIDCYWKGKDSNISILDNGTGMNLKELITVIMQLMKLKTSNTMVCVSSMNLMVVKQ